MTRKWDKYIKKQKAKQRFWWIFGCVVMRPLRKISSWCVMGSFGLRILPRKKYYEWDFPNVHYWIVYETYGRFAKWLDDKAWRYFCDWTGGSRKTYPFIARVIHKLGKTMVWHFRGSDCYHCGKDAGHQIDLVDNERYFKLEEEWTSSTENGTDHRFKGITTCPCCGFQQEYEDGSL